MMICLYNSVREQKEQVQRLKQQVTVELNNVEEQLHALQDKQKKYEEKLKGIKNRSSLSEEEEVASVLEEQCLVKELSPLIKTVLNVKKQRAKLTHKLQWVKILKYELHKGKL